MTNIKVIVTDEANECDICGKYIPPKHPYIEIITTDYATICTDCVNIMFELANRVIISGGDNDGQN